MVQKKMVAISFEEGDRFRARVLARTLLYVFSVTSTFFCWLFSNYVQDYLKGLRIGNVIAEDIMVQL